MKVTQTEDFLSHKLHNPIPNFFRLNVNGEPGINDFGIAKDLRLVLSEKALDFLNRFNLARATYAPFE